MNCCLDHSYQSSHTSVIRANYVFLLETMDVKFSGLVGQLYSDHVVSRVERDDISAEQTSFRANEKLLSVLSRKSPQQFQLFLDALDKCGQQHVRNVITGLQGASVKTSHFTHTHTTHHYFISAALLMLVYRRVTSIACGGDPQKTQDIHCTSVSI